MQSMTFSSYGSSVKYLPHFQTIHQEEYSQSNPNKNQNDSLFKMRIHINNKNITQKTSTQEIEQSPQTGKKPMKWGEPTWFFFHTIAEKVIEQNFPKIRAELLNHIYLICSNLPCPICSEHAMKYISSINFSNIETKQQLKDFFFNFHNIVNNQKGYPLFKYEDLDSKYSKANTVNIIYNFVSNYQDKSPSIHMIANDIYRKNIITKLKKWFNVNIQNFL